MSDVDSDRISALVKVVATVSAQTAGILEAAGAFTREQFADALLDIAKDDQDWRYRQMIDAFAKGIRESAYRPTPGPKKGPRLTIVSGGPSNDAA